MWTRRQGLTRLDVVVISFPVLLLLLLFSSVLPVHLREDSSRARCASNLRQIGEAMKWYAQQNGGSLPRTRWDPMLRQTNSYTKPYAANPFAADGPLPNDVTASLYLLVRGGLLRPEVFLCPVAERGMRPRVAVTRPATLSNFPDPSCLHYSVADPFPDEVPVDAGYQWNPDSMLGDPDFALAADMNPGNVGDPLIGKLLLTSSDKEKKQGNSRNHGTSGQNVLYADGHVVFSDTPFAGARNDNIYTRAAGDPDHPPGPFPDQRSDTRDPFGKPTHVCDSVMLPVATIDPGNGPFRFLLVAGGCIVLVGLVVAFVIRRRKRRGRCMAG